MTTRQKELTDQEIILRYKKEKVRRRNYMTKRRIWGELMIKKAELKGLTVTDNEVTNELKRRELIQTN